MTSKMPKIKYRQKFFYKNRIFYSSTARKVDHVERVLVACMNKYAFNRYDTEYVEFGNLSRFFTLANVLPQTESYGGPGIMPAISFSLKEANDYLRYGHLTDRTSLDELQLSNLQYPGEIVMIRCKNRSHFTSFKVVPSCVKWRNFIRNIGDSDCRNPLRAFFHHSNALKFGYGPTLLPIVQPGDKCFDSTVYYMKECDYTPITLRNKMNLLALNMALALPFQFQKAALSYPNEFDRAQYRIAKACRKKIDGKLIIGNAATLTKYPQFKAKFDKLMVKVYNLLKDNDAVQAIEIAVHNLDFDILYQMSSFMIYAELLNYTY